MYYKEVVFRKCGERSYIVALRICEIALMMLLSFNNCLPSESVLKLSKIDLHIISNCWFSKTGKARSAFGSKISSDIAPIF